MLRCWRGFCKRSQFQICIGHWTMLDSPPMRDPSNSATVCSASSVEQYDGREQRRGDVCRAPHTGTWTTSLFFTILAVFTIFFANWNCRLNTSSNAGNHESWNVVACRHAAQSKQNKKQQLPIPLMFTSGVS